MPAVFYPPVVEDVPRILPSTRGPARRLMRYYSALPRSRSVVKVSGTYRTVDSPEQSLLDPLTQGVDYFLGGHYYVVSDEVAAALVNDGFTVDMPGTWGSHSSTAWGDLGADFWQGT